MNAVNIPKFPELIFEGRHLVWDSRQRPYPLERVFVPQTHLDSATREALLARPNAEFVREPGLGGDHEVQDVRWELGRQSALACGEKSKDLKVIAITGTNGKTTTTSLLRHLLVELKQDVVELGTLGCRLFRAQSGQKPVGNFDLGFTTPLAPQLHLLIQKCVDQGFGYLVMEASSQGIELGRLAGLHLTGACYLNLTQDHLDFHGTMESYGHAKLRLFSELLHESKAPHRFSVVNVDEHLSPSIVKSLCKEVSLHLIEPGKTFQVQPLGTGGQRLIMPNGVVLESTLMGEHNAQNIATAVSVFQALELDVAKLHAALLSFPGAKGRLERVSSFDSPVQVFVDYAHTPDALEKILQSVRRVAPEKFLSCVFGCGGDRDASKRPLMGRIASEWADRVYLTADNSRSELTADILRDIESGISSELQSRVLKQEDRALAIRAAICEAHGHGGVVIIAGKGHEEYQILQNQRLNFSDQRVAEMVLAALHE